MFVLHVDRSAEWTSSASSDNWVRDLLDWRTMLGVGEQSWGFVPGEATLEVADSIEALRGHHGDPPAQVIRLSWIRIRAPDPGPAATVVQPGLPGLPPRLPG